MAPSYPVSEEGIQPTTYSDVIEDLSTEMEQVDPSADQEEASERLESVRLRYEIDRDTFNLILAGIAGYDPPDGFREMPDVVYGKLDEAIRQTSTQCPNTMPNTEPIGIDGLDRLRAVIAGTRHGQDVCHEESSRVEGRGAVIPKPEIVFSTDDLMSGIHERDDATLERFMSDIQAKHPSLPTGDELDPDSMKLLQLFEDADEEYRRLPTDERQREDQGMHRWLSEEERHAEDRRMKALTTLLEEMRLPHTFECDAETTEPSLRVLIEQGDPRYQLFLERLSQLTSF